MNEPVQPVVVVVVRVVAGLLVVAGALEVDGVSMCITISGVVEPTEFVVTVVSVE